MSNPSDLLNVNRRAFIAASGALVVGYSSGLGKLKAAELESEGKPPLIPDELDSYLEISMSFPNFLLKKHPFFFNS